MPIGNSDLGLGPVEGSESCLKSQENGLLLEGVLLRQNWAFAIFPWLARVPMEVAEMSIRYLKLSGYVPLFASFPA